MDELTLSVVIPARDEEGCILETVGGVVRALRAEKAPFEILVVDDGSMDSTAARVQEFSTDNPEVRLVRNTGRHGFGSAVRYGLEHFSGNAVAVMMADGSDSPADLIAYYRKLQEGNECVFGSRFSNGGKVIDYPVHKLILNRLANAFIRLIFGLRYNDITNAFKGYRREVIRGLQPLISPHFNLTVEMPLKSIVRGYSFAVVPISWTNRKTGFSKLKIKEMGSRYLFIVLYLWLEKHLSRGDYVRQKELPAAAGKVASRAIETSTVENEAPSAPNPTRQRHWFQWPDTVWLNLVIAGIIGSLYALFLMGPGPLNPRKIGWLTPDPAYHYIGWELFRQDPHLHWPITYTDRLGYPAGESIALVDLNPLLAVLLKPLSPLLPEPFQYFGIEVAILCVLQLFFALRLFRLLLGPNPLGVLLSSLFFLISPPLTYRFVGHYSLSNHWLLVAALFVLVRAHRDTPGVVRQFIVSASILAGIAVAINPYLAFQVVVLLATGVASLLWQGKLTWRRAAVAIAALCATCLVVAYLFGFFIPSGHGYSNGGYRYYSLNLLSPIDPYGYGSVMFPPMPQLTGGQYEGYNYLGAGIIILAAMSLPVVLWRRKVSWQGVKKAMPLLLCCGFLTLLALSTKLSIGSSVLVDLDPGEKLTPYMAPLRATGRLFWSPYYVLLAGILAAPFLLLRKGWANLLIFAALVLQVADTAALRHWVHSTVNQTFPWPFRSPVWSKLGSTHENLLIMPPWQCGGATPGGPDGYRLFGYLATAQKMRTNSFQSARYNEAARDSLCNDFGNVLSQRPLSPDSAYVVNPELVGVIGRGPTGPGKCHSVDNFILCSSQTDFGLGPGLKDSSEPLPHAIDNPGFEIGGLSGWRRYQQVEVRIDGARAHTGGYSLAQTAGTGSVYQDLSGLEPGGTYTITGWVSASPGASATAQIAAYDTAANIATFSEAVTPRSGWRILSHAVTLRAGGVIRLHLVHNQGSGTIYWDDIRAYLETGYDVDVANGNFDDGALSPWATYGSVQAMVTTEQVHSGKFSLSETAGKGSVYQDVAGLVPGARYIVSASVSASPGTTATAQIALFDAGVNVATFSEAIRPKTTWGVLEKEVTASSSGCIRIHLFRNEGIGGIFWDDVRVAKAAQVAK